MYTPHALSDCTSLREVTLPAALTAIGDYAFQDRASCRPY